MLVRNEQIIQLKRIINEIVQEQTIKTGIDFNVEPLTIIEYWKSPTFQKELKLMKLAKIAAATTGFYNSKEKNICVFVRSRNLLSFPIDIAGIVKTVFHELRHAQQHEQILKNSKEFMDYKEFIMMYELLIGRATFCIDYALRHDEYFAEIDANLYGVNNAIEYLEKNNLLTEENKIYLELKKKEYELDYENFDIQLVLKKVHNIYQSNNVTHDNCWNWFFSIFYTDDLKKFKSISEIISNPNINRIDKKILTDILSSEHFLKSVNFSVISEEEKNIIINAINETLNTYINKRTSCINQIQQELIDSNKWLKLESTFCDKITYYNNIMTQISKKITYDLTHCNMPKYYSNLAAIVDAEEVNDKRR